MSFESIQMTARGATIKDRVSIQKKGVVFRFSDETLAKLGWANGDTIDIQRGTGEHHGLVRLTKATYGRLLHPAGRNGSTGLIVKIGKRALGGGKTLPDMPDFLSSQPIIVQVIGGAAQFALPWVQRPAETSDEAIARGFPVKKGPSPTSRQWASGGNPVRGKASILNGGRI